MLIAETAKNDLKDFKKETREKLLDKLEQNLADKRNKDKIKYISKPSLNVEFHRLKIKEEGLDHRAYFDYQNSETVVFAVRHRDHSYTPKDLKETQKRKKQLDL